MRESGVWTYAVVNLTHILGVSALFGAILVLDLRLIGVWRSVPLAAIGVPTVRVGGIGFALAALSGMGLLATKATEYQGNPFFYIKFPAIALGLANIALVNASEAWKAHRTRELSGAEQSRLAKFGGVSLGCWLTAMMAGRMIAYW
jgi:hypothetical protein